MKIVLRKDVEKLGDAGTVHTVSDGFARNYLIPQGFAVVATPGELKVVAENTKARERKIAREEQRLQSLSDKIEGKRLEFTARSGEEGRLYGSVTAADIAERLSAAISEEIDRRKVVLEHPIRTTGEHRVVVHLVGKLKPQITVIVAGEHVVETAPEAEAVPEEVAAS